MREGEINPSSAAGNAEVVQLTERNLGVDPTDNTPTPIVVRRCLRIPRAAMQINLVRLGRRRSLPGYVSSGFLEKSFRSLNLMLDSSQ